jgi:hypothetical protein
VLGIVAVIFATVYRDDLYSIHLYPPALGTQAAGLESKA